MTPLVSTPSSSFCGSGQEGCGDQLTSRPDAYQPHQAPDLPVQHPTVTPIHPPLTPGATEDTAATQGRCGPLAAQPEG